MGGTLSHLDGTGSQLVKAVKSGNTSLAVELISAHPRLICYADMRQFTVLHFAARTGSTEMLQQLFAKAEELDYIQQLEERGRLGVLRAPGLVAQLANAYTDRGVTPLMLAAQRGCSASVKLLLLKGASPWAVDKLGGRTALHYAMCTDNIEVVEALLAAAGGLSGPLAFPNRPNTRYVDVRTQSGFTAVHFAVHAGCLQSLAVLLNAGANPMLSSLFDCLECINCPRGSTALHLAARHGNMDACKQLIKAYVDQWQHRRMPDPRLVMDGEDRLPCQVAMRRQHNEVARMLLPSTPLSSLFADGELTVLGPASLAEIAGTVLRQTMERELQNIQQTMGSAGLLPGQEPSSAAAAADAIVSVPAGDPGHERQLQQDCGDRPNTAQCKPFGGLQDLQGATTATVAVGEQPAGGAAWNSTTCRQVSSCASEEVCGVCFEARPCVALEPCKHQLCIPCCAHLLEMHSRCVLMCPFCRGGVGHLAAAEEALAV